MRNVSIRQAVERALLQWLQASFANKDEFQGCTFTKGQTSAEITMPMVGALCPNAEEVEVPGVGIYLADAAIVLMTTLDKGLNPGEAQRQAIDDEHRIRADIIANKTQDLPAFIAELSATNRLVVYGLDLGKASHDVAERHFIDRFDMVIMCRCV